MTTPLLSFADTAARYGWPIAKLSRLVKHGLPVAEMRHARGGGVGRPSRWFDPEQVDLWIANSPGDKRWPIRHSAKGPAGRSPAPAAPPAVSDAPQPASVPAAGKPAPDAPKVTGIEADIRPLRSMFRQAINDMTAARGEKDWLRAGNAIKTASEASKILLAWERERTRLQQDRGESIPWSEHVEIFRATVGIVAQEFRACGKTLATDMLNLKDPRKAFIIADRIIRNTMRHVEAKLREYEEGLNK